MAAATVADATPAASEPAPASDPISADHERLSAAASGALRATHPALRNGVSSHRCPCNIAFPAVRDFVLRAGQALGNRRHTLFLGSIDAEIVVSARLRGGHEPVPTANGGKKKKRLRDDCGDRAEQAVASIRKRVSSNTPTAVGQLEAVQRARETIETLLRNVKGPRGEEVFESCGLSLSADPSTTTCASPPSGAGARPRLIIACRLSAGVPLPLAALQEALGECFRDGMLTTRPESLSDAYQLPLSAAGRAVEASGQRSLLLFAAVPIPAPAPLQA